MAWDPTAAGARGAVAGLRLCEQWGLPCIGPITTLNSYIPEPFDDCDSFLAALRRKSKIGFLSDVVPVFILEEFLRTKKRQRALLFTLADVNDIVNRELTGDASGRPRWADLSKVYAKAMKMQAGQRTEIEILPWKDLREVLYTEKTTTARGCLDSVQGNEKYFVGDSVQSMARPTSRHSEMNGTEEIFVSTTAAKLLAVNAFFNCACAPPPFLVLCVHEFVESVARKAAEIRAKEKREQEATPLFTPVFGVNHLPPQPPSSPLLRTVSKTPHTPPGPPSLLQPGGGGHLKFPTPP